MKTIHDPRHRRRVEIMRRLFALSFSQKQTKSRTTAIFSRQPEIDELIKKAAPQWPLSKIAKIDLAILRLSVFELAIEKKQPPKVIIDEAVELAKEYGGEGSPPFVNGVLGTIYSWTEKSR